MRRPRSGNSGAWPRMPPSRQLAASARRCALAILDPPRTPADEVRWLHQIDWLIRETLSSSVFASDEFDRTLSPLDGLYLRAVARHCHEGDPQRALAFRLLQVHVERTPRPDDFFARGRPAALILDAEPEDFEWLMKILDGRREQAIKELMRAAEDPDALFADEPVMKGRNASHRQARALIALARLAKPGLSWPALRRSPERDLRTWLIHDAGRYHIGSTLLIDRLRAEVDRSARASLVLALGGHDPQSIDPQARRDVAALLLDWYRNDPDPGLHGAVSWLLRARWNREPELLAIDRELRSRDPAAARGWFINGRGQTFAVIRGPQRFLMGIARPGEPAGSSGAPSSARNPALIRHRHDRGDRRPVPGIRRGQQGPVRQWFALSQAIQPRRGLPDPRRQLV